MATRFAEVVAVSDAVGATRSRTEKIRRIAELLRRIDLLEVAPVVRLLVGRARREALGVGPALVHRARAEAAAAPEPTLEIGEVVAAVAALRDPAGAGSGEERKGRLVRLLCRSTPEEQSFIARWLVGELRQGALEGVVAEAALRDGEGALQGSAIRLFHPLLPMLAATAASPQQALGRLGEAAVEAKLDGVRIQLHKAGERVEVYSRKRKRMTEAVPEIVESAHRVRAERCILDGEAIALRPDGRPEPFQGTMRRFGRKLGVDEIRREVPLVARFFDCLYLADEPRTRLPQRARWRLLAEIVPGDLRVSAACAADSASLDAFVRRTLDEGHEGVILKSPMSPYRAGRRGGEWLKWKPAATLDLVVLAAEWGHGRRRGRLSNLHLGARDPASGGFVAVGKTFKGLTDEMLAWQTEQFLAAERGRDEWTVYVEPRLVVEVAFDGVQRSSQYAGGAALRFARVKRYRPDKTAAEADTIDLVRSFLAPASRTTWAHSE